jgi:anaerobic selenocysteine-containing dehydrogenase
LTLLTGKTIQHTKSRTNGSYWLLALEPENGLKINPIDAKRLGFKDGDRVKVVSASNPGGVWKLGIVKQKA